MTDGHDPPHGVLSDADIERLVDVLRAVNHKSAWDRVLEIGRLVFDGIMGSDEVEWRSRRSRKNVSLRKLVQHPRCPFKKSALCAAVNIYLFAKSTPLVTRMPGVSPTHVALTLGLEPSRVMSLLNAASDGGWSVHELEVEVRSARKEAGERRGRPISPANRKAETMARRAAVALRKMHDHLQACAPADGNSLGALQVVLDEIATLLADTRQLPVFMRGTVCVVPMAKASHRREETKRASA